MRFSSRLVGTILFVGALVSIQGCSGPAIDIAASVKAGDVTTGWFDAGIVDGKNKLVPSASFTITNSSSSKISALHVFSVFRFVGETEELGSSSVVLRGNDALGPSSTSKPITVRAHWGLTGEQPRAQMLMHKEFRDARVEIFAKYGSGSYVKLIEVPVKRQLLTN
jgi:hypothetical protein